MFNLNFFFFFSIFVWPILANQTSQKEAKMSEFTIENVTASIPNQQLLPGSFKVATKDGKKFSDWTKDEHASSYQLLQKIAAVWQEKEIENYLIYAKDDNQSFDFEIVPYQTTKNFFTTKCQQILVLWRTVFGGKSVSDEVKKAQIDILTQASGRDLNTIDVPEPAEDPFCKSEVIERQRVLKGEEVNVLYSNAPIGFGGDKLHFLVVPKKHYMDFSSLPQSCYTEAMEMAVKVKNYIAKKSADKDIFIYHKKGKIAGQTVGHWHLHLVAADKKETFWGRLNVFKNILLGSSKLKDSDLKSKVETIQAEISLNS